MSATATWTAWTWPSSTGGATASPERLDRIGAENESGRWGPYRQAGPSPARHRPGVSLRSEIGDRFPRYFNRASGWFSWSSMVTNVNQGCRLGTSKPVFLSPHRERCYGRIWKIGCPGIEEL